MSTMKNYVTLLGIAGGDAEVKTLSNEQKVARFSLAVNESYLNANNERVENTQWFNIVAWGNCAQSVGEAVKKGKRVAIEGHLHNNEWTDKDGNRRMVTEIWADSFFMVEFPKAKSENTAAVDAKTKQAK